MREEGALELRLGFTPRRALEVVARAIYRPER